MGIEESKENLNLNHGILFSNKNEKISEKINNSICLIKNENKTAYGFICTFNYPDNNHRLPVLFTCEYILGSDDIKKRKNIKLAFNKKEIVLKLDENRKIYINENNICVIELKEEDYLDINNILELEENILYKDNNNINESVYIIYGQKGLEAKYTSETIKNIDTNNNNIINENLNINENNYNLAPILNIKDYTIIGMHMEKNNYYNIKDMIDKIIKEFNKLDIEIKRKNEIILNVEIKDKDINKKIYFLDNADYIDKRTQEKHFHDNLKELNEVNTKIYINEEEYKYSKYFIPYKKGIYKIKIKLNILMTDCSFMFGFCNNIILIDLSSFNSKNVTNMNKMFYSCTNLNFIDFSSFNTQNVTNMKQMFYDCNNLIDVNLSSFDTRNVKHMSLMFYSCTNITKIDLSSFDTKNVIDMNCMFAFCGNLASINLSSFNTKNVKDMSFMFLHCFSLSFIDLSSFDFNNISNMVYMFYNCSSLSYVNIKDNININSKNYIFYDCNNLIINKTNIIYN